MDFRKWRIYAVLAVITPHILHRTQEEIEYGLDICKSTKDAHLEIYYGCQKMLRFSSGMEKALCFMLPELLNLEKSQFSFNYSVFSRKYACRNQGHKYVCIFTSYFEVLYESILNCFT
jgi:hypothetical protein